MKKRLALLVILLAAIVGIVCLTHSHRPIKPLADIATADLGATRYEASKWNGWYRPGSNKCNQAVADWIVASGHPRPRVPGHFGFVPRDPSAHEWADPNINIPGWSMPVSRSQAQPGDIIAQRHGSIYGHVGVVVAPGQTISAYGEVEPQGLVRRNDWGFRTNPSGNGESSTDPPPVVRHYIGT